MSPRGEDGPVFPALVCPYLHTYIACLQRGRKAGSVCIYLHIHTTYPTPHQQVGWVGTGRDCEVDIYIYLEGEGGSRDRDWWVSACPSACLSAQVKGQGE